MQKTAFGLFYLFIFIRCVGKFYQGKMAFMLFSFHMFTEGDPSAIAGF